MEIRSIRVRFALRLTPLPVWRERSNVRVWDDVADIHHLCLFFVFCHVVCFL